jgi:hypothetical protein
MDPPFPFPRKRGDPQGGQPRTNTFHHPEKLFHDAEDDDVP